MFWVMYHVDQPGNYTDFPLIMWLQGGPGASGVGYGNFEELGPYDLNGNLREYAWTKRANVMFVDNPVGSGYSYVEDPSQLTTNNSMIADDLVTLVKNVFGAYPDMQVMPFYVFAESYGGKMTVDFALAFDQAIKNGEVVSDFRGVALGDSWIEPMDFVNTWGTFLYQMGFVMQKGLQAIDDAAAQTQASVDAGNWEEATNRWSLTELVVLRNANDVNFYNVLATEDIYRMRKMTSTRDLSFMTPEIRRLYEHHVAYQTRDALGDFMNGPQADRWGIPDTVVWDSQGGMVFNTLAGDFMKPVVDSVVRLLTETTLDVVVFTGDLDLICDTPGTYRWIENMEWPDKTNFLAADNAPLYVSSYSSTAATLQRSGRLSLYTIFRSGHMVPIDAPEMALNMLDLIFANSKKDKQVSPQQQDQEQEEPKQKTEAKAKPVVVKAVEAKALKTPENQHSIPHPVKLSDSEKEVEKEEKETAKEVKEEPRKKEMKEHEHIQEKIKKVVKQKVEHLTNEEKKEEEHEQEAPKKQQQQDKQENKKQKSAPKENKSPVKKEIKEQVKHAVQAKQQQKKEQEKAAAPKVEKIKEKIMKLKQKHEETHEQQTKKEEIEAVKDAAKVKKQQKKEQEKAVAPKVEKIKEKAMKLKQKQEETHEQQTHEQKKDDIVAQHKLKDKLKEKKKAPAEHKEKQQKEKKQEEAKKVKEHIAKFQEHRQKEQKQKGHQKFRHVPAPLPDARRMRR